MSKPLADKVALVTGAGRGIGRSIAISYANAGANVCVCARTQDEIDATATAIQASGGQAVAVRADITQETEVGKMVAETVTTFGALDILVANAGVHICHDTVVNNDPAA